MIVYRLTGAIYSRELTGEGSSIAGGRWNNVGNPVVYTSATISLSLCEQLVHIEKLPMDFVAVSIHIPEENILKIDVETLTEGWDAPIYIPSTTQLGDAFIKENKRLIMQVPSAIIHTENNYLINPNHKEFSNVKIVSVVPFSFDRRLKK